ncbi:MAG: hypothetical protein KJ614_18065 [Gammaproteobacteria bacterium]|uniref:hypothetical protein n=1 Tax=Rhodoferax sp. TaxID=50421 RepID=UPI0017CA8DB4|nr:hypothetical protein [Rhodoferax sp.]MBU3900792.1 hypothetical protein [Gammaproteobacteria bacterium]MBA3056663.1 hypothetical protein [Rhodoferax sp.]MBU3997173.1 hypothetical protein [Gammaproteobacteria bacterium]MBU4079543.1 hypothetical protein [Gammaproteobacteria bacterium]MBU4114749.1 hypothetical protein [Gammaproteobacteria bacterium]
MYDLVKLTHLVAAIIWLGGMTFMLVALRPAALAALERPERLRLMGAVWKRFFIVVVAAIVVVLVTGTNLYTTVFRALKMATGTGSVPLGWNLMLGIGLLMVLVFGHMFFAGYAKFKRAAAANDWPLADQAAAQIHALTVTNFVLGWLALLAVRLVH